MSSLKINENLDLSLPEITMTVFEKEINSKTTNIVKTRITKSEKTKWHFLLHKKR